MTKLKVNDLEIEMEDGLELSLEDGGKRIVIRTRQTPPVFIPTYVPPITIPLTPPTWSEPSTPIFPLITSSVSVPYTTSTVTFTEGEDSPWFIYNGCTQ